MMAHMFPEIWYNLFSTRTLQNRLEANWTPKILDGEKLLNHQYLSSRIGADCSILRKCGTRFDHVTLDDAEVGYYRRRLDYKINGSTVKGECHNTASRDFKTAPKSANAIHS